MEEHIQIPDERIGVLIGSDGETKKEIEKTAEVTLEIDSKTGIVRIIGEGDPLKALKAPDVVKAIARGFPPESALKLLESNSEPEAKKGMASEMMVYDSLNIKDMTGSDSEMKQKKGRLIGKNGRTRELMEELTGADVRIYGKTIGFIGNPDQVEIAINASEMLIDGAPHGRVYSYMERKRSEMNRRRIEYL